MKVNQVVKKKFLCASQQAEILEIFASSCSGYWSHGKKDQGNKINIDTITILEEKEKENIQDRRSSVIQIKNKEKYCILSLPSFSLSEHFNNHHDELNKKELEEIAISQLSLPFQLVVPQLLIPIPDVPDGHRQQLIDTNPSYRSFSANRDIRLKHLPATRETLDLSELPSFVLDNISRSLLLLIDARLRAYAMILLRHYNFNKCANVYEHVTDVTSLDWKVSTLLKLCDNIRILNASVSFKVNKCGDETNATVFEDDDIVTVPLSFSAELDLQLPVPMCSMKTTKVLLNSCGSICGSFNRYSNGSSVNIVIDSKAILKSLINQARVIAEQVVQSISCFHINVSSPSLVSVSTIKALTTDDRSGKVEARPILLNHTQKLPIKRKKVFSFQTPELSSENSDELFSSMEYVLLPPSVTASQIEKEDTEFITIIDSVMEVWDLSRFGSDSKRRKLSPVASSFIQSY